MEFIEIIENSLRDYGLFKPVKLWLCLVLIPIVAVHIFEERLKGFRRFFNQEWFGSDKENFPVSNLEALLKDQLGLFVLLSLLSLAGAFNIIFILVAVGFVTADLVQHAIFSISKRQYTPGVATSVLYLGYVVYFDFFELSRLHIRFDWTTLVFMALGAGIIVFNYLRAARKVRKRNERQKQEPVTT